MHDKFLGRRSKALSDVVFAIAATVIVLEIKLPVFAHNASYQMILSAL